MSKPIDVDTLAEAIEYLTVGQGSANLSMAGITKSDWDALAAVVAAARRFVELVKRTPRAPTA